MPKKQWCNPVTIRRYYMWLAEQSKQGQALTIRELQYLWGIPDALAIATIKSLKRFDLVETKKEEKPRIHFAVKRDADFVRSITAKSGKT